MWEIANPLYLTGAAALLIPVLIHLYNRRKNKVKIMGNLSWLKEIKPSQSHFRRIHQWPLMILRLLIVSVALLLLIDLQRTFTSKASISNIILIHPDSGDSIQYRQLAKNWSNDSVSVHWLQPNLPKLEEPGNPEYEYNLWTLIAEADFRFQPEHIHVITPNRMDLFGGNIPPLNAAVSWQFQELTKDTLQLVDVIKLEDNYEFQWYQSNSLKSGFARQIKEEGEITEHNSLRLGSDKNFVSVKNSSKNYQVPVRNRDSLLIFGNAHQNYKMEWMLMQNVIQALSEVHNFPVSFVEDSKQADWIFLFNEDSLAAQNFEKAKLMFTYKPINSDQWLESETHEFVLIRKKLNTGNILEGGLFEELRPYFLYQKFKNVKQPVIDYRNLEIEDIPLRESNYEVNKAIIKKPDSEVRHWLIGFLFVLILIERGWPKKIN